MKRKVVLSLLGAIAVPLLFTVSCKKPEQALKEKKSFNHRNLADVTAPTVESGILTFTSQEHLNEWLEYLDGVIARDSTSTDTTTQDSLLHEVEIDISFNSLRQITYQQFATLNSTGWSSLEEIPQRHFIHDLPILSTLNQYAEVKIGDDIYSIFDNEYYVVITDPAILTTVRTFKASYTSIEDIFLEEGVVQDGILVEEEEDEVVVNTFTQSGNVKLLHADNWSSASGSSLKASGGDLLPVHGVVIYDACDGKKVYIKKYIVINGAGAQVSMDYTVGWGDGSSPGTYNNQTTLEANHTYANNGPYTIEISATDGLETVIFKDINVTVGEGCINATKNKYMWYEPGSGWAILGNLEVRNGPLYFRVNASSQSFLLNGNTYYETKCQNLYARACVEAKNGKPCGFNVNKCDKNSSTICKYISVSAHVGGTTEYYWGNTNIYSEHALYGYPNWYPYTKVLYKCD